jgi:hypothetical protein
MNLCTTLSRYFQLKRMNFLWPILNKTCVTSRNVETFITIYVSNFLFFFVYPVINFPLLSFPFPVYEFILSLYCQIISYSLENPSASKFANPNITIIDGERDVPITPVTAQKLSQRHLSHRNKVFDRVFHNFRLLDLF